MRLELHGYHERISSLRAGLRTWLDHISRLRRLAAEYGTLCDQLTTTLENARSQADKPVPDQADLLAEDIQLTEVSCLWFIFVLRGSGRDEITMQFASRDFQPCWIYIQCAPHFVPISNVFID